MAVTLILVRHAKSDWHTDVPDRRRPLSDRGVRQATATAHWLGETFTRVDLALVSVATRAQQTWGILSAHLHPASGTIDSEDAYTFDGEELAEAVSALPGSASTVILVGHNPALEELIGLSTGHSVPMRTSAVAVLELPNWGAVAEGKGTVIAAGRPADDSWSVRP
ncbi:SixA phosphatase family protein [Tessaracoccus sp. Y36]